MGTNEIHDLRQQVSALTERVERQYRAVLELRATSAFESIVLSGLLEHHEDLAVWSRNEV